MLLSFLARQTHSQPDMKKCLINERQKVKHKNKLGFFLSKWRQKQKIDNSQNQVERYANVIFSILAGLPFHFQTQYPYR
jgi:hypothetical protein